ncbi:unnamed protein product [Alternaria alternata]
MSNMFGFMHRPPNTEGPLENTGRPTTSGKSTGGSVPQIYSAYQDVQLRHDRMASPPPVPRAPSVLPSPSPPPKARQTRKVQPSDPAKAPQVLAGNTAPGFCTVFSGKKVPRSSDVAGKSVPKPLGLAGKKLPKSTPTKVAKKTANRVKPGVAIKYNYDADKAPIFRGHVTGGRTVTDEQYCEQEIAHYQRTTGHLIPKINIVRLTKSVMKAFEGEYPDGHSQKAVRITGEALDIVHEAVEEMITSFLIAGQIIAESRKVKTVTPADLKVAVRAARVLGPYSRLLEEHDFGDPEQRGYVRGPVLSGEVVSPLRPRATSDAAYLRRSQAPVEAARPRRTKATVQIPSDDSEDGGEDDIMQE